MMCSGKIPGRLPQIKAMINHSRGFTLIELMITIAVIGVLSAVAIPAYQGYIETANMTRVTANFEEAVRLTRNTLAKDQTLITIGLSPIAPVDTNGWLDKFNRSGIEAPGGGPAYIPSSDNKKTGRGDPLTGAIGVKWSPVITGKKYEPAKLELWRPLYISLIEQRVKITTSNIEVENQRSP